MNVLYTCDDNYVWLMGISMISLFDNNKDMESLTVYLLGEKISEQNKVLLNKIAQEYKRECVVIDVPQFDIPKSLVSERWPLSAFTRLFSAELLPRELGKILYLDCDTIVCDSISYIDALDVSDKTVLGIKDCVGKHYKENIGLNAEDVYINAGVLVLNLNHLRTMPVKENIEEYMSRFVKLINYADQDILNGVFKGNIGILPPHYNVMTIDFVHSYSEIQKLRRPTNFYTEEEFQDAILNPRIIHYTTNMRIVRPWFSNSNHPQKDVFTYYFLKSPWNKTVFQEKKFLSKEDKIIGVLQKLPKKISYTLLGQIHSVWRPLFTRLKSRK